MAGLILLRPLNRNTGIENGAEDSVETEEKQVYRNVYQQYGKELREIYRCRPGKNAEPVTEIIRQWAEMKTQEGIIRLDQDHTTERYIRFTTETMSDILPDAVGHKSGWNTENFYFYELRNTKRDSEHEVFLELILSKKGIPEDLMKMSDRIGRIQSLKGDSRDHRCHFATDHIFIKANADDQTVTDQLDLILKKALDFENELTGKLGIN